MVEHVECTAGSAQACPKRMKGWPGKVGQPGIGGNLVEKCWCGSLFSNKHGYLTTKIKSKPKC